MIFIKSACCKRVWVKCKRHFPKEYGMYHEVQLTCVTYLHYDRIELESYLYVFHVSVGKGSITNASSKFNVPLWLESSWILGLECCPACFHDSYGAWSWAYSWEICCLLENHTTSQSFRGDRSAKAHFSLDGGLFLWQLDWVVFASRKWTSFHRVSGREET